MLPDLIYGPVSTHSRPKAAGSDASRAARADLSFNTQPPEGGWSTTKP